MEASGNKDMLLVSFENENEDKTHGKYDNILQIAFNAVFIIAFYALSMYFYYTAGLGWSLEDCFYFVTVSINL